MEEGEVQPLFTVFPALDLLDTLGARGGGAEGEAAAGGDGDGKEEEEEEGEPWSYERNRDGAVSLSRATELTSGTREEFYSPLKPKEVAVVRRDPGGGFAAALLVGMARRHQLKEVKRLVGELGVPVDAVPPGEEYRGMTAAHWAASRRYISVLRYLCLEAGADLTVRDSFLGATPLHVAIQPAHTRDDDSIKQFIQHSGTLSYAPRDVDDSAALFLLRSTGADPNARDGQGMTPLHWAALCDRVAVARCLLWERGADAGAVVEYRGSTITALKLAQAEKKSEVATLIRGFLRIQAERKAREAAAERMAAQLLEEEELELQLPE